MKSDYERNKFKKNYTLISVVFLLAAFVWSCIAFENEFWKVIGTVGIVFLFDGILYALSYRTLDRVFNEIEYVSGIMTDVIEKEADPPLEEYKEGAVGILYTNFYKMVNALQESKNREMDEKIFLRDIISDISHQLKTPLASLMVFMELLDSNKLEDEEKRKQIITEAGNQLNRMEWMVLSMLKLARIEAGAIQFQKREVYLESLLLQAAEGVQFLIKDRSQQLMIKCDSDILINCDGDWLVEAVINLLKNASDYSGEGKLICVETEQTPIYTRIYIKDEGVGIPEQELPNIFKRFYRVHQEVNPNSVGIGLSLTKSIIEGMGGSIGVRSEVERYTWFIITFVK